jgi:apolipoprotein N-acyltransferase
VLTRDASGMTRTEPGIADATIYFQGRATINVSRDTRWIGRRSFYVEHGDWFVALCTGLAGLGYLFLRFIPAPAGAVEGDV